MDFLCVSKCRNCCLQVGVGVTTLSSETLSSDGLRLAAALTKKFSWWAASSNQCLTSLFSHNVITSPLVMDAISAQSLLRLQIVTFEVHSWEKSPAPPALMPGISNCNCCKFASRTVRRPALYERRGDGVAARIYVARRRWRGGDVDLYRRRVDGVETT